eukprot:CAMPEP_0174884506 /NCGR_PEP_ID=MMETSP1114-20130205/85799_1 /TAXON_ID=312471 /ORGANISM="Neobodo designis, Strain CCAP 1951/1" /LENGTH=759 /DNA_ID=CAMNT_0016119909 /DNA_START=64 /DNA_END=2343 /DNA_ORIENTATION=+
MKLLSWLVSLLAAVVAFVVRVVLRCLTMAVSHRFPSAPLGDVEVYTALWCLSHAQAIYDLCFNSGDLAAAEKAAEDSSQKPIPLPKSALQRAAESRSAADGKPPPAASPVNTPPAHGAHRVPPIDINDCVKLHRRAPATTATSAAASPDMVGHAPPNRRGGVLFFVRCRDAPRGVSSWSPGTSGASAGGQPEARAPDLPLPAMLLLADAAEMDLAVLTVDPLHGKHGMPDIDAAVDAVVAGVRAMLDYFREGGSAPGSGGSLTSTPTMPNARVPSFGFALRMPSQLPPRVVLGGSGFGATVAMLALVRRYVALSHCEGLLLVDPFVGWAAAAHSRRVSFIDESFGSTSSGDLPFVGWAAAAHSRRVSFIDESFGSTSSGDLPAGGIPTQGSSLGPSPFRRSPANKLTTGPFALASPNMTPKRSALASSSTSVPGSVKGSYGNGAATASAGSPRSRLARMAPVKSRAVSAVLWDAVHDLCQDVKTRVRKGMGTRPLRQWFPAAQWSAHGSDTPLCLVLDATSVWLDDQLEFVAKWQTTGDDVEFHVWSGDRSMRGDALPPTAAALRQRLRRPSSAPGSGRSPLPLGEAVVAAARWLEGIRGVPSTPEVSMMMASTPYVAGRYIPRDAVAPGHAGPAGASQQHGGAHVSTRGANASFGSPQPMSGGPPPGMPSWAAYQSGLPAPLAHPPNSAVALLQNALPTPMMRVPTRRAARDEGNSLVSASGRSPVNAAGDTAADENAGLATAPSADSISELLRDHPH